MSGVDDAGPPPDSQSQSAADADPGQIQEPASPVTGGEPPLQGNEGGKDDGADIEAQNSSVPEPIAGKGPPDDGEQLADGIVVPSDELEVKNPTENAGPPDDGEQQADDRVGSSTENAGGPDIPRASLASDVPQNPGESADAPAIGSVEELKVPDTRVDLDSVLAVEERVDMRSAVGDLQVVIQDAFISFEDRVAGNCSCDVRDALRDWSAKFQSHISQLGGILQEASAGSVDDNVKDETVVAKRSDLMEMQASTGFSEDVETVRFIGQQLESRRTGQELDIVVGAWSNPEEMANEVTELRRVRRQIRYIFGGMLSSLPDSSSLTVDDLLLQEQEDVACADIDVRSSIHPDRTAHVSGDDRRDVSGDVDRSPRAPQVSRPEGLRPRPRSGVTEMTGSSQSSMVSHNSAAQKDEEDRRRERREKRRRSRRRDERERREPSGGAGPAGAKQWNWADEVVKASLDPQNRWEFPNSVSGCALAQKQKQQAGPSWEQPRYNADPKRVLEPMPNHCADSVASRARERADEVLRHERERQQPSLFDHRKLVA